MQNRASSVHFGPGERVLQFASDGCGMSTRTRDSQGVVAQARAMSRVHTQAGSGSWERRSAVCKSSDVAARISVSQAMRMTLVG
eukprot:2798895-Rhodomonas_salina.2